MKAKTDYVPKDCDYLTAGKVYDVKVAELPYGAAYIINDDTGDSITIYLNGCPHLYDGLWTVIDEEEKVMGERQTVKMELRVLHTYHITMTGDLNLLEKIRARTPETTGKKQSKSERETIKELDDQIADLKLSLSSLEEKIGAANEPDK